MVHLSKYSTIRNRRQNKFNDGNSIKIVRIKMKYSIEPGNRIYVKGYRFLSFAKNMGKSLSYKYGQKLLDSAKNLQQIQ